MKRFVMLGAEMLVKNVLRLLEETSSLNAKAEILKDHETPTLRKVLHYACNPFLRFNLNSKIDGIEGSGSMYVEDAEDEIFFALDSFAAGRCRGDAAVGRVEALAAYLTPEDFNVVRKMIKKDLRCGVSDSTINKVFKDLVPTFDVQLAADPKRIGKMVYPAVVERKYDGMRAIAIYDGSKVEFLSRGGKPINTLAHCVDDVISLLNERPGVLDCEAMSSTFNDTISSVKRKTAKDTNTKLYVFDYIPYDMFSSGECKVSQHERNMMLSRLCADRSFASLVFSEKFAVENQSQAEELLARFLEEGFEGAIVKSLSAGYQFKRNDGWIKLKKKMTNVDLRIIGYEEGTGKHQGKLGAFVVDFNGKPCRVGTGYSDDQRAEFWERRNEMIDWIIEVAGMEITPDGAIRHPVFKRVRTLGGAKA